MTDDRILDGWTHDVEVGRYLLAEERVAQALYDLYDSDRMASEADRWTYTAALFDGDFNTAASRIRPLIERGARRRMFKLFTVCGNIDVVDGGPIGVIRFTRVARNPETTPTTEIDR